MVNKKAASNELGSFLGCMLGCAIGDALGAELEGKVSTQGFEPSRFSGRWTDDTHMMIGVAESLIECNGFDGHHMTMAFIRNYEQEPWRGYAPGPPSVFRWIKSGVPWNEASKKLFGGAGSLGNGAAMRVAPIGLFYHDEPGELRHVAYESSQITHAHELGKEGAAVQARAVALAANLALSQSVTRLEPTGFLQELMSFSRREIYLQKLKKAGELLNEPSKLKVVRELGNSVEAHNSVPIAIYSFLHNVESFKEAVLHAVSLGGDADTIGAMTGAISGAYHGVEDIPKEWRSKLERKDYIERLAETLSQIKGTKAESVRNA